MTKRLLLACVLVYFSFSIYANAITVTNLSVDPTNQEVTFDLEWMNSWRLDATGAPFNWDAAWVFVKYSPCDSTSVNLFPDWYHGKVNTAVSSHSFGNLEPVLNDGTIGIADSLGVMLRRDANGLFSNNGATTITMSVPSFDPTLTYHVRVVAIEMVYVTQGSFQLGNTNYYSFDSTVIANENAVTLTSIAPSPNNSIDLGANYPKGFNPYHVMKYEISHGQYATFLNTLNSIQANNRYYVSTANRHDLTNGGFGQFSTYTTDRPDRAYNYLSWDDCLSYLDWAALAPMTELQYEKACRGSGPYVLDEYAWGTTNITNGLQFTGAENGTEYFVSALANATHSNVVFIGGDGGRGPARCGIFALPTNTTREQSGATYFGIMEMSGNLHEHVVNVSTFTDITGTVAFVGTYGDGDIDATGLWNTLNWPAASNGNGLRGGSFADNPVYLRVGNRNWFNYSNNRTYTVGGRGIR